MNSGVQKVLIIAIVEDIPEKYESLRLVFEKLSLEDVNYYIAFDLKCANVLFDLPSHAGKKSLLVVNVRLIKELLELLTILILL